MDIRFGTDGWRGIIAREFTFEAVSILAQATMDWLSREGLADAGLIIGYDRRFLSCEFAQRVAEVAAGNNIPVRFCEEVSPTPAISWAVKSLQAGAGIIITASHNPSIYNGFKVKERYGGSARPETTHLIEQIICYNQEQHRPVLSRPFQEALTDGSIQYFDASTPYIQQLGRMVDIPRIRQAGLHVVADPMFGAGSGFFSRLLGCQEIHTDHNPSFGGHPPEPIGEHLQELGETVRMQGAVAGLALDGDADRIGAVDETGSFFSSHAIFTVILQHLLAHKALRGGIVKTVSATELINRLAQEYDQPLYETPIGFKHVCELMLSEDILMGGEESGGIGLTRHMPERDGILMGLLLLETIAISGKPLGQQLQEIMARLGQFHYQRIDLTITQQEKQALLERFSKGLPTEFAGRSVTHSSTKDGYKFFFEPSDWLLIRPSGTEPVLRLYCEASTPAMVEQLLGAARYLVSTPSGMVS